jgi:hypothetical protein
MLRAWVRGCHGPAVQQTPGGRKATTESWEILRGLEVVQRALGDLVSAEPSLKLDTTREPEHAWTVTLQTPQGTAYVALDAGASRALVDATLAGLTGLHGAGRISDAERGVLEYLTLALLHRIARLDPKSAAEVSVRSFGDPVDSAPDIRLRLVCAGLSGFVSLSGLTPIIRSLAAGPLSMKLHTWSGRDEIQDRWFGLRLAAVPLQPSEFQAVVPGDLLLTGIPSGGLDGLMVHVESFDGWRIAPAILRGVQPTFTSAEIGEPSVVVPDDVVSPRGTRGEARIRVLTGRLSGQHLATAQVGACAVFQHEPDRPVALLLGEAWAGAAELVSFEGQIAARVLDWRGPVELALP